MRLFQTPFAILALASIASLYGENQETNSLQAQASDVTYFKKESQQQPPNHCCVKPGSSLENARGCQSCCMGGTAMVDFLFWNSDGQDFNFAANVVAQTGAAVVAEVVRTPSKWAPGFRAGAVWNTEWDAWDVGVNWTWYRRNSSQKVSNPLVTSTSGLLGLYPVWPTTGIETAADVGPFQTATGSYSLLLNAGDLEVSRSYHVSKTIAFDPFWGVRGEWLYQDMHASFANTFNMVSPDVLKFKGKNHNWGLGPRVGFSSRWDVGQGFSLFGRASTSLLYGRTGVGGTTRTKDTATSAFVPYLQVENYHFWQLVPTMQLQLGFNWMRCFDDMGLKYFAANLSWETNIWWNQANMPMANVNTTTGTTISPSVTSQPVTLEGLTFNVAFGF